MKYAQLVMGPAGSGKSTYCNTIYNHCLNVGRHVMCVNLDPACEHFNYPASVDIRDLISLDDVLEDEELTFGPNGALVFCMEYLTQNFDWLHEHLNEGEDDYFIFDLPGQIELYTHLPVMRQLADALRGWDFNVCSVFLIDTQFVLDSEKFVSGALTALSAMVSLETPHVNVLTKMDMLSDENRQLVEEFLETDPSALVELDNHLWNERHRALTRSIAQILEEYSLVKFLPLDSNDEDSITEALMVIDNTIQYGEDLEVKDRYPEETDDQETNDLNL
ncbi:unnamed protein product, partial [Mesorhabditis belari]|uniref:GPN-loop GTPase 3 n=1 Tax=Mesorhabditis belari TaxID=2138241 RepID=A0AAF3J982_9BILA